MMRNLVRMRIATYTVTDVGVVRVGIHCVVFGIAAVGLAVIKTRRVVTQLSGGGDVGGCDRGHSNMAEELGIVGNGPTLGTAGSRGSTRGGVGLGRCRSGSRDIFEVGHAEGAGLLPLLRKLKGLKGLNGGGGGEEEEGGALHRWSCSLEFLLLVKNEEQQSNGTNGILAVATVSTVSLQDFSCDTSAQFHRR